MSSGTWYSDPSGRHQVRYATRRGWTDFVADSGRVSSDPLGGLAPVPVVNRSGTRLYWAIWAAVALGMVLQFAGLVVLTVPGAEPYTADLTTGHGRFTAMSGGGYATTYEHDGYHVRISDPNVLAVSGIKGRDTDVRVEVESTALTAPSAAAFGPFCGDVTWQGYALLVDAVGSGQIVQLNGPSPESMVTRATVSRTATVSARRRLALTCSVKQGLLAETIAVAGYVDGIRVAGFAERVTEPSEAGHTFGDFAWKLDVTGFVGLTRDASPAEWSVSTFSRRPA